MSLKKIAYTLQQAAEQAGVSQKVVSRAIRDGQLLAKYPTSRPVILHDDLVAWVEGAPSQRKAS